MRFAVFVASWLAAACALGAAGAARAQDYPSRPLKLVVGYAPGGPVDTAARIVAPALERQLGQPVVIDNRGGASGVLAAAQVAKSPADGYTLFFAASATQTMAPHVQKSPGYDPLKDYTPVGLVVTVPNVLMLGKQVPAANLSEFIAWAKAHPDKASYGSAGPGASNHLAGELLAKVTGVPLVHVPYKGNGPAMADLMGGQISFMFDAVSTGRAAASGGRVVALAVTSAARHPLLPDVPTMAEAGLPGFVVTSFYALEGPPGLPPAVVLRLNRALRAALAEPELAARLVEAGYQVTPSSPDELAAAVKSDHERWGQVAQGLKFE